MAKNFLLIIFFCMTSLLSRAQNGHSSGENSSVYKNYEDEDDIIGDTSVNIREIVLPRDSVVYWKNHKNFEWAKHLGADLKEIEEEAGKKRAERADIPRYASAEVAVAGWMQIILWTVAGAVVLFILYKLFLNGGLFKTKALSRKPVEEAQTEDERYIQRDFDYLIREACQQGDFRVATRYQFLKTLQRLTERSLIEFAIDKTNSKYLYEIPVDKREDFAGLILHYEYVWYGHSQIGQDKYNAAEVKFNSFLNKI